MDAAKAPAIQLAAQTLHENAKSHKRLADHHRRQARQQQRRLEELTRECAENGIELRIDTAP